MKENDSQPNEQISLKVDGINFEKVHQFKYLGSIKADDDKCLQDMKYPISIAKQKIVQLNSIRRDRGFQNFLIVNILKCLKWPVATSLKACRSVKEEGKYATVARVETATIDPGDAKT